MPRQISETNRRKIIIGMNAQELADLLVPAAKAAGLIPGDMFPTEVHVTGDAFTEFGVIFKQENKTTGQPQ